MNDSLQNPAHFVLSPQALRSLSCACVFPLSGYLLSNFLENQWSQLLFHDVFFMLLFPIAGLVAVLCMPTGFGGSAEAQVRPSWIILEFTAPFHECRIAMQPRKSLLHTCHLATNWLMAASMAGTNALPTTSSTTSAGSESVHIGLPGSMQSVIPSHFHCLIVPC